MWDSGDSDRKIMDVDVVGEVPDGEAADDERRATFERVHGVPVEEWLRRWRESELPDTLENNFILGEALALRQGRA